jgi:glyoxylase-like metal-dependent hydrolase (beta-lactamase superfamily II)
MEVHSMTRYRSQFPAAAAALVFLATSVATAIAQDYANVQIQSQHVGGKVHVLVSGVAGNIGVSAGDDGILIVDDQFAPLADKIRKSLEAISAGELVFVVNTHWHQDHTGGNEVFGREATIVAHDLVRKRLLEGSADPTRPVPPAPAQALPVITYADGITIHFNGEQIDVRHLPPGHTDGDSMVWFRGSNVVHLGDDFFADRFPFVDLSSGGSPQSLADAIGKILEEVPDDVTIIPGHGPVTDKAGLRRYHTMLLDTIAIVREAKAAGRPLAEVEKAGFGDKYASWSLSFINTERWAQILYAGL